MSGVNNTSANDLSTTESNSNSAVGAPPVKTEHGDSKNSLNLDANEPPIDLPQKPLSAYTTVAILCLMIAFGGFIFGWDTGTISGFVNLSDFIRRFGQKNDKGTYYLSKVRMGLIVSIFNIGCAIGGIVLSKVGDIYGRRIGLITVTAIYVVGILIQITSINKWYQYFIGRIISGLGVGGIAVLSPMLISEVAPKHIRGTLVQLYQLMGTMGIFLGYCTNYGTKNYHNATQWRVGLGLCFAWATFMVSGMMFVPESPRYLIEVGKDEEAKRSLSKSNKVSVDDPALLVEYDTIKAGIELEKLAGNASWSELLSTKTKVFQRVLMGVMIQSLQQLTGDNYFFYYGTTIFKSVGLKDSFQTSIIIGVVNFFSSFIAVYTIERFGRRTCLLWGAASMLCCFAVFASVGVTKLWPQGSSHQDITSQGAGNCMIVFTMFFIFSFATTWAGGCYVIVSETFPLRVKSRGMAIATAANWTWGFLISFFTPFITGAINFYYGYVFLGCLVFAYFYVFFFVPETKGLTLEEVNTMWLEGVPAWKSASWVPPGRRTADYDADAIDHDDRPIYKRFFSS
ncbi:AVN_HP_G0073010.mRNA.1.CDS.1 [Saccharomyces cerevisiae]|nr:AVN_HP_G0034990.mRNA.1.CDS.1 [Saccharomyces cerevisiae]CAI5033433.1 AVN_HP_G0073010.mRNA.1.CDS.1 [Saccharomyces cerevisiae]CAI6858110.1 AVN_HP_G0034990.mRNA.1.CDS.1 [Saccharomyces cerevisiae]CAI6949944.1 AVN_HP_G0073010.mRNA.1.CDS.1 [Saccharomyces cerevisiae]CAI7087615.1 AVN_collapsed_G0025560.mRNA.1.CDS.1 [Saccharomyces cerevisiae]